MMGWVIATSERFKGNAENKYEVVDLCYVYVASLF